MSTTDINGTSNAVVRRLGSETFAQPVDAVRGTNIGVHAHHSNTADPCVTEAIFIPRSAINPSDPGLTCTKTGFGPQFERLILFFRANTYRMVSDFASLFAYRPPDGQGIYLIRYASFRRPDPEPEAKFDRDERRGPGGEPNREPSRDLPRAASDVIEQPEHLRRATANRREFPASSLSSNQWAMTVFEKIRRGEKVQELGFVDAVGARSLEQLCSIRRLRNFGGMVDTSSRDLEASIRSYLTLASGADASFPVPSSCQVSDLTLDAAVRLHTLTAASARAVVPTFGQLFATVSFASPLQTSGRVYRVLMPRHMAHAICVPHEYLPCSRWRVSRLFPGVSVDDLNNALRRRMEEECTGLGGATDRVVEAAHIAHGIIPVTDPHTGLEKLLGTIAARVDVAYAPALTTSATIDERLRAAQVRTEACRAIESAVLSNGIDLPMAVRASVAYLRDTPPVHYHIGDYNTDVRAMAPEGGAHMRRRVAEHLVTPSVGAHFDARLADFVQRFTASLVPRSTRRAGIVCHVGGDHGEQLDTSFMSLYVGNMVTAVHRASFRLREIITILIVAVSATLQHDLECGKLALGVHGAPGGGKTFMSELVRKLMIPGTVKNELHSSGQAFLNGNNYGHMLLMNDEAGAHIGVDDTTIVAYNRTLKYAIESGLLRSAHERFSRIAISGSSNIDVSRTVQGADDSAPANYSTQTLNSTLMDAFLYMTNASKGSWSFAMYDRLMTLHLVPNPDMIKQARNALNDQRLSRFGRVERTSTARTGIDLATSVFQAVQAQMVITSQASAGGVNRRPDTTIIDRFQEYYNAIKIRLGTSIRMATRTDLMMVRLAITSMRMRVTHMQQLYLLGTGKPSQMTAVGLGCSAGAFEVVSIGDCMTALTALAPGGDTLTDDVHRALCAMLCDALQVRVAIRGNAARHAPRYDHVNRRIVDGGFVPINLHNGAVIAMPADVPRDEFIPDDRFSIERMLALAAEQGELSPTGMIRITDYRTTARGTDDVIRADVADNFVRGRQLPDGVVIQGHGGSQSGRMLAPEKGTPERAESIRSLARDLISHPVLRKYRMTPDDKNVATIADVIVDIVCTSFANSGCGTACATSLIEFRGCDAYVHPRLFTVVMMLDDAVPVSMMLAPDMEVPYTTIDCSDFDSQRMVTRLMRPIDPRLVDTIRSVDEAIARACSLATRQPVSQAPVVVPVMHADEPVLSRNFVESVHAAHVTHTFPDLTDDQNLRHISHPDATRAALDFAESARSKFVQAAVQLRAYVGALDDRGKARSALENPHLAPRTHAMLSVAANRDVAHSDVAGVFRAAAFQLGSYLGYCSTRVGGLEYVIDLADIRVFLSRWGVAIDPNVAAIYHDGMERLCRLIYATVLWRISAFPGNGSGDGPPQLASPFPTEEACVSAWDAFRDSEQPFPPQECVPVLPNDDEQAEQAPVPIPAYVPARRAVVEEDPEAGPPDDDDVFGPQVGLGDEEAEEQRRAQLEAMARAAFGDPDDIDHDPGVLRGIDAEIRAEQEARDRDYGGDYGGDAVYNRALPDLELDEDEQLFGRREPGDLDFSEEPERPRQRARFE